MEAQSLMRAGVRARVTRLTGVTRRWSSPVLLAMLSAGAVGPLLLSGVGTAALATAGIGALTAVGGNVLTDIVKSGVAHMSGRPSQEEVETELERRIQQILEEGGEVAERLRGEIAGVLREVGAVGAAIEAAVDMGDRELQARLAAGLAAIGEDFAEFGFVLADLRMQLSQIRDGVDRQSAELQVAVGLGYRQAADTRLLLEQVAAIERRTRPGVPHVERPWSERCPYRGLVPFDEADAEVFYGRELLTAQLVTTVAQRGLLVVTGASGAGKSSLLRAGLLPALARGELSQPARDWPRHVLNRPALPRLATLLAGLAGLDAPTVLRSLADDPDQADLLVRQAVEADARRRGLAADGLKLVLVVDQFEEIFSHDQRVELITALHRAASEALIVIAVRGDFIDRCAGHPQLAAALQDGPFIVGPMTVTDLRRVITGPADAAGLEIESDLIDTILTELRSESGGYDVGVLPLLSQTMLTIWENREDHQLTSRGYALTGGVTQAVATSAETVYAALDPSDQTQTRRLFHQLTTVSADGRLARRTAPRTAFDSELLDTFARKRLIVVDDSSAQIAHDTLLHAWPRLRGWLEADIAGRVLYDQLWDAAEEWTAHDHAPSFLYRGERLASVVNAQPDWQADQDRYPPLSDIPRTFLETSIAA
ncbi:hypothetical protein ACGFNU_34300 [Spirillospora sp. NPDC048911]|uniref:nSTAND1 domain-containing NTPase n=1 Tax=Spirillospora sp. NPDC048911 TaxID=3364527 RepID=UPI0037116BB4